LAILSLSAFAQKGNDAKGGSASQAVIRTEARLVLVDAIVRDKKGKIVADLDAGDFRLWEDGKEQPITSLSLEKAGAPDQSEAQHLLFLFDRVGFQDRDLAVRQAVANFAGAYASPNRYMAVVDFDAKLRIAQNLTAITERVQRAAVSKAEAGEQSRDAPGAPADFNSLIANSGADPYMSRYVLRQAQQQAAAPLPQWLSVPLLDAIGALADGTADVRGRKLLVVLGDSRRPVDAPDSQVAATARACNRANVAVYATDAILKTLAEKTGGRRISNDLINELGAIVDERDKRYVLGFKPVESPDGSCHTLRVKIRRDGLDVQARNAYCNTKAQDLLAGKVQGRDLETRAAGPSPGNAAATMELPYFYSSPGIALVDLAMEMDLANLKFVKQNGKQHADWGLVGLAYGADGAVAGRFSDAVPLDFATLEETEAFRKQPYRYERQFRLPAGKYNVRVAFGSGDQNFGKVEAPLTIAAWDGQHLAVSGIALSSDASKAPDLASDLDPSLLEGHKDLVAKSLLISPSGRNRFRGSAPCFGYLEISDPELAGPNPPAVNLEVRVLDRGTGEQKVAGAFSLSSYMRPGNPVVPVLLRAPIASLPLGSYVLELKVVRSPGSDPVVRTVEFQVVEAGAAAAGADQTAELMSQPESAPPAPPPPVVNPAPDSRQASESEQEQFLAAARKLALDYAKSLPNFLCTQTVNRFIDQGRYSPKIDTLTVEVGYYQQEEGYSLTEVDGAPVDMDYTDVRGTISRGEFGSNLRTIFDPASAAEFHFVRWTTLRGRRAAVYSYRVERSKAHYAITAGANYKFSREQVGLRGEAVIDGETYGILRLNYMAADIPSGFPVRRTSVTVDYGDAEIGGKRYLLPLKAVVELQDKSQTHKNEVTFHSYRKFSSDSSISFGEEEPKPQP